MGKVYNEVLEDYKEHNTELSSAFFDFEVGNVTFRELLDDYKNLQKVINGDDIFFLDKVEMEGDRVLSATILDYGDYASFFNELHIPAGMTASYALETIGKLCRIYRVYGALLDKDTLIKGQVLDFLL